MTLTNDFDFSKYDVKTRTKLVTHGFQSSGRSDTCVTIKNNYLEVEDINVIILDWGPIASTYKLIFHCVFLLFYQILSRFTIYISRYI